MSTPKEIQTKKLLKCYTAGKASNEELKVLFGMLNTSDLDGHLDQDMDEEILSIQRKYEKAKQPIRLWFRIAIAAAVAAVICGIWFFTAPGRSEFSSVYQHTNKIKPGKNTAILTLANGKTIQLSDVKSGISIDGEKLMYNDGSLLDVEPSTRLTITTPRGGTYQVDLPDGTKVWLNAESSLVFPLHFSNSGRVIELKGEGYFEVAKVEVKHKIAPSTRLPFIVLTPNQKVEVLGTHFNINSYSDEPVAKTTLLEGSLRVSSLSGGRPKQSMMQAGIASQARNDISLDNDALLNNGALLNEVSANSILLKPGQESVLQGLKFSIEDTETGEAIAWKNGLFFFNNENLESIMRKISRWYNVKVAYKNQQIKKDVFLGSISRFQNLTEVLKMLKETGDIQFEWQGSTLIIDEN